LTLHPLTIILIDVVLSRGGAVAARRAHNPKVVGSNPTPATKFKANKKPPNFKYFGGFFILNSLL
jgi:hypothetical protein